MISVAFMPCPIACNIGPICHQPDFIRHVLWAEDIHPDKPCGAVDNVRTENESSLDLGIHVIGHDKSAQDANRLLFQLSNSSRKNFFSESTPTDGATRRFSLVRANERKTQSCRERLRRSSRSHFQVHQKKRRYDKTRTTSAAYPPGAGQPGTMGPKGFPRLTIVPSKPRVVDSDIVFRFLSDSLD
jgi:hypothetical protein